MSACFTSLILLLCPPVPQPQCATVTAACIRDQLNSVALEQYGVVNPDVSSVTKCLTSLQRTNNSETVTER